MTDVHCSRERLPDPTVRSPHLVEGDWYREQREEKETGMFQGEIGLTRTKVAKAGGIHRSNGTKMSGWRDRASLVS
jgi:hypothetical protein